MMPLTLDPTTSASWGRMSELKLLRVGGLNVRLWILAVMQVGSPSTETMSSFEDIFHECYRPVSGFFTRRGCSREESQDLTQDTFVRAYNSFDRFRGDAKPLTWLFTIATNVWRNRLRDASAAKRDGDEVSLTDEDQTVRESQAPAHDRMIDGEKNLLLEQAVEELPSKMRQCVVLRVYQSRSYREIADLLGVSEATAKSHVSLAKSKLRSRLAEHYPDLKAMG